MVVYKKSVPKICIKERKFIPCIIIQMAEF
jgi:hypothetical protein